LRLNHAKVMKIFEQMSGIVVPMLAMIHFGGICYSSNGAQTGTWPPDKSRKTPLRSPKSTQFRHDTLAGAALGGQTGLLPATGPAREPSNETMLYCLPTPS